MIRNRLLEAAKRVGRKLLLPEGRAGSSVRARAHLQKSEDPTVDPSVLPPIVQGDGDTPGPNHKSNIGRTWASAQLVGGAGIVALDVRSPSEWIVGHLPGAIFVPREALASSLGLLPGRGTDLFVAVYDATGNQGSDAVAEYLRGNGWARARRLVGGFAEWVEEGEEILTDEAKAGSRLQIGDSVALKDGRNGTVWRLATSGEPRFGVLVGGGDAAVAVDCAEREIA